MSPAKPGSGGHPRPPATRGARSRGGWPQASGRGPGREPRREHRSPRAAAGSGPRAASRPEGAPAPGPRCRRPGHLGPLGQGRLAEARPGLRPGSSAARRDGPCPASCQRAASVRSPASSPRACGVGADLLDHAPGVSVEPDLPARRERPPPGRGLHHHAARPGPHPPSRPGLPRPQLLEVHARLERDAPDLGAGLSRPGGIAEVDHGVEWLRAPIPSGRIRPGPPAPPPRHRAVRPGPAPARHRPRPPASAGPVQRHGGPATSPPMAPSTSPASAPSAALRRASAAPPRPAPGPPPGPLVGRASGPLLGRRHGVLGVDIRPPHDSNIASAPPEAVEEQVDIRLDRRPRPGTGEQAQVRLEQAHRVQAARWRPRRRAARPPPGAPRRRSRGRPCALARHLREPGPGRPTAGP